MQVKDLIDYYHSSLSKRYSRDEIQQIIRLLNEANSQSGHGIIMIEGTKEIPLNEFAMHQQAIERLREGEPLQYILGYTYFHGIKFLVNNAVLIPRPETEELVEWIVAENKQLTTDDVLDIGTGSGCIAIALKKYFPQLNIYGVDVSKKALEVATENASMNQLDVKFFNFDITKNENAQHNNDVKDILKRTFDLIVSNPPYIPYSQKASIADTVDKFEPELALYAPSEDPLHFYRHILNFSQQHLKNEGSLFLEVHHDNASDVIDLLKRKHFKKVEMKKDISGNERLIKAQR